MEQQLINTFKNLDSQNSAYWFGYLCGDGNLHSTRKVISLGSKDLEHLERFKEFIGMNNKITDRGNYYEVSFTSEEIYNNLLSLGMTPRKSKTINGDVIPKINISHFIRGLFDADGSVGLYKFKGRTLKKASLCIYGNYPLLKEIQKIVNFGGTLTKLPNPRADSLIYGGRFKVIEISKFLYKDAKTSLERKRIIIDEIVVYNKKFKKYFHKSKYEFFDKNKRPLIQSICKNCGIKFKHRADCPNRFCSRKCSAINRCKNIKNRLFGKNTIHKN